MKGIVLTTILFLGISGLNEAKGYGKPGEHPHALFILDTKHHKEIKKTVKFIEDNEGGVSVINQQAGVIFGRLPRKNASYLIGKHHITAIYFEYLDPSSFPDEDVRMAIFSWNNLIQGEGLLPIPTLLSPKEEEKIETTFIEFLWETPLPKAKIEISKDLDFNDCVVNTIVCGKEYKFASCYLDEGKYYWRVCVLNEDEKANSSWTMPWSFKIGTFSLNTLYPPALRMPTNTSSFWPYGSKPIYQKPFYWDDVEGALGYRIQVSDDKVFKKTVIDRTIIGTTTCDHKGGKYRIGARSPRRDEIYYWRVSSFNEKGKSLWSEIWSFCVIGPDPPGYLQGGCNPLNWRKPPHKRVYP